MERIHQLTKEFMITAGQTVRETPSVPTVDEMKLRLSLEFEELKEKAQAMGLEGSFAIMVEKFVDATAKQSKIKNPNISAIESKEDFINCLKLSDTGIVDLVEVFDAALDQRVVASGTDLAFGMQHIIPAGDQEVWRSNMSKFDDTHSDAETTRFKYEAEGKDVNQIIVNNLWVTRDTNNKNKILKSHAYSPADLGGILEIGENEVDNAEITTSEKGV